MLDKINFFSIIKAHIKTLYDASSDSHKTDWCDISYFYLLPLIVSFSICILGGYSPSENLLPTIINFSAIFISLLLSVLVLIYDQKNKIELIISTSTDDNKKNILRLKVTKEVFVNISYAIIIGLLIIILCFLLIFLEGTNNISLHLINFIEIYIPNDKFNVRIIPQYLIKYLIFPLILFLIFNLFITILMVVKRIYQLFDAS